MIDQNPNIKQEKNELDFFLKNPTNPSQSTCKQSCKYILH